jgi:hypothetical protein
VLSGRKSLVIERDSISDESGYHEKSSLEDNNNDELLFGKHNQDAHMIVVSL